MATPHRGFSGRTQTNSDIINITWLRIPTGGRQTSWLFTSLDAKLNKGLPEQHQLAVRTGFEPATYGFQIRRSNQSATLPPVTTRIYVKLLGTSVKKCQEDQSYSASRIMRFWSLLFCRGRQRNLPKTITHVHILF